MRTLYFVVCLGLVACTHEPPKLVTRVEQIAPPACPQELFLCPSEPDSPPADALQDAAADAVSRLREAVQACHAKIEAIKACVSLK